MASQAASGSMQKKNVSSPEETRPFDKGKMEVVKLPTATIGRGTFEPGWKWSECVKPIAQTESCQAEHTGYCLSGRMHVVMTDGSEMDAPHRCRAASNSTPCRSQTRCPIGCSRVYPSWF